MPATSPEEREDQMIAYADALAEQQLRDGTASAQVITHYLRLGSSREKLEQERIRIQTQLDQAKADAIASQARSEEMFKEAITAFQSYRGHVQQPQPYEGGYE